MKTTWIPIVDENVKITKHTVGYYPAVKRKQAADIPNFMNKSQKHAEWKKPSAKLYLP